MLRHLLCIAVPLTLFSLATSGRAAELLVFVSAFAPGEAGAIQACRLDLETGKLTETHKTGDIENPFFMALSPDKKTLYSIHAPGSFGGKTDEQVAALAIENDQGQLRLLNRQSTRGTASCYLHVDATGQTLVVANYTTGNVAALPVRADGSLDEAATTFQHAGASINPTRQMEPHPHCMVISPDNRFAYVADLGIDQVLGYRLQAEAGKIAALDQPAGRTAAGAGPRHLTFHPRGPYVYVINELDNTVTLFDYDSDSGKLTSRQTISTLPDDFDGTSYCADLKITPDGRFLYGTNRGHDSIAAYRLDDQGRLTRLGIHPSLGKGPQNLAITPDGRWLLCANMPGNNCVVFRIDPDSGGLTATGEPLEIRSPSCIMWRAVE
ncbi:MAG: lactonase family protein [Pirellulaceae bacterium]|nr:lactonase family protein [Pirellulaceae bacterium]